ncbi:UDP-galactopyranose mutase [Butyrivibrio sp. AC2005]|uniref:UDP-galactopyranose mutase n=1 Tax=Butyrivibrio sp. AC2005 TaxID=1280672 RepID=UPI0003FE3CD4|nr:UDP-galactopyranose mutase [Butyrivibrio sp. AC2005]
MYDYLLVGSGLFNAVVANELNKTGAKCLVVERRNHIGGNCYTYNQEGIIVHAYGAHIFRTSDKRIWDYLCRFAEFNHFINSPIARYNEEIFNLPFNMNTFSRMWGVFSPEEAKKIISNQGKEIDYEPSNLEEHAIKMVGRDIYEKLIKGYTEKQWGKKCSELPISIMRRIPLRFTYDNNYYNDYYQGIPIGGYTPIIEKMFKGSKIVFRRDYCKEKTYWNAKANKIIYTGAIDEFYDYKLGRLDYRSLRFETERINIDNYQGVAVVNYTSRDIPYTRIIEHKHFEYGKQTHTIITREYPELFGDGMEPFYPINDEKNTILYRKYVELSKSEPKVILGGRLGTYQYTDMQDTIKMALDLSEKEIRNN